MNFRSENPSNEELECRYKLFCLPEQSSGSIENMIDRNQLSLNEAIEKKIRALELVNQIGQNIQTMKRETKKCEKNLKSLQDILNKFF